MERRGGVEDDGWAGHGERERYGGKVRESRCSRLGTGKNREMVTIEGVTNFEVSMTSPFSRRWPPSFVIPCSWYVDRL